MDVIHYQTVMRIIGVFSLPIAICGSFCLITVKVYSLSFAYKRLLLAYVIFSSVADVFFTILFTPVILAPVIAGYNVGIIDFISPVLQYSLPLGMSVGSALVMELQFHFRFNCLLPLNSRFYLSSSGLRDLHLLTIVYGVMTSVHIYLSFGDSMKVKEEISKEYPCLKKELLSNDTIYIAPEYDAKSSFFYYFSATSFSLHCILVVAMVAFCLHCLSSSTTLLSHATKKSATYYLKCLLLQFAVHTLLLGVPFIIMFYGQVIFRIGVREVTYICMMFVSLQGSCGTATMMMVMKPYRKVILRIFGVVSRVEPPVSIVQVQPR